MRRALGVLALLAGACAERGADPTAPEAAREVRPAAAAGATLALGVSHTCALAAGQVYCWGYGGQGQLGGGSRADAAAPTRVSGLDDAVALTAGAWHTCALRRTGEVLCWGDGSLGQVGDGELGTRPRPRRVPRLQARAIAAGGTHTCAIGQAGEVWCWGSNYRGEIGAGEEHAALPVAVAGAPPAQALAAGDGFTCALAEGAVWCWGDEPLAEVFRAAPAPIPGVSGAVTLAAGARHACAGLAEGRLLCWGTGREGQLGDGRPPRMEPARSPHAPPRARPRLAEVALPASVPGDRSVVAPAVGGSFACAARGGSLWCWGSDRDGQLGDGGEERDRDAPAPVPGLTGVAEVALGPAHACARLGDGSLWCWGYSESGQVTPASPTVSGAALELRATGVAVGGAHACAWADEGAWCWGEGAYGQLGDGGRALRGAPTRVPGLRRPLELVAGSRHTCALDEAGEVWCWGDDTFGQLAGRGAPLGEPIDEHRGPLPLPPIEERSRPTPGRVEGLRGAIDLGVFEHRTCAVIGGSGVTCWHAGREEPLTPVLALPDAREVAVGAAHACARLASGEVRCWGVNHTGRLGDGTTTVRSGPVPVRGLADAVALAAGRLHTCALRRGGEVVCWGDGFMGQLGDGTEADRHVPTLVPGVAGAQGLAVGVDSTCAIDQARRVLCWGAGEGGVLGDRTESRRLVPVRAELAPAPARTLALGARTGCATAEDRPVACWGATLSSAPARRRWHFVSQPAAIAWPRAPSG